MSTRTSLPPEMTPARGRCSVCGDTGWRAIWRGHRDILICWSCAVDVLPRLIADATYRRLAPASEAAHTLDHVRAEYWRAVAIAILRDKSSKPEGQP